MNLLQLDAVRQVLRGALANIERCADDIEEFGTTDQYQWSDGITRAIRELDAVWREIDKACDDLERGEG